MFIIQTKSAKNMNCVSQVSDRMILKTALQGLSNKDWFVSVDLVRVQEKGELQIGEVVEKKARKRKSKSDNKSIKKPSIETPTEAKGNLCY